MSLAAATTIARRSPQQDTTLGGSRLIASKRYIRASFTHMRKETNLNIGQNADDDEAPTEIRRIVPTTMQLVNFVFEGLPSSVDPIEYQFISFLNVIVTQISFMLIIISVVNFGVETLPQYKKNPPAALFVVESVCIAGFTLELILRFITAPNKKKFIKSFLNWVDLVAIIPYYVDAGTRGSSDAVGGLVILRVLRLLRVLRVLKLSKHNVGILCVAEALTKSVDALTLLVFLLVIDLVVASSCIFFAEQADSTFDKSRGAWYRDNGARSPFQSVFHGLYWGVATVTTVGYGDEVPKGGAGKAVAAFTMMSGIFVIAFPTVIIGATFSEIYETRKKELRMQQEALDLHRLKAELEEKLRWEQEQGGVAEEPPSNPKSFFQRISQHVRRFSMRSRKSYSRVGSATVSPVSSPRDRHQNQGSPTTKGSRTTLVSFKKVDEDQNTTGAHNGDSTSPTNPSKRMDIVSSSPTTATNNNLFTPVMKLMYSYSSEHVHRGVVVDVTNKTARFAPVLQFSHNPRGDLVVYREAGLLTLQLILHDNVAKTQVAKALKQAALDPMDLSIEPLPIQSLHVEMVVDTDRFDKLSGIKLLCKRYNKPIGMLPITIVCPSEVTESTFLRHFSRVKFDFTIYYERPAQQTASLAPCRYIRTRRRSSLMQIASANDSVHGETIDGHPRNLAKSANADGSIGAPHPLGIQAEEGELTTN